MQIIVEYYHKKPSMSKLVKLYNTENNKIICNFY